MCLVKLCLNSKTICWNKPWINKPKFDYSAQQEFVFTVQHFVDFCWGQTFSIILSSNWFEQGFRVYLTSFLCWSCYRPSFWWCPLYQPSLWCCHSTSTTILLVLNSPSTIIPELSTLLRIVLALSAQAKSLLVLPTYILKVLPVQPILLVFCMELLTIEPSLW